MNATKARFRILEYTNPIGGSQSWRVTGTKRDGSRIRENYSSADSARIRQVALESEFLARETQPTLQATRLTDIQTRLAEKAFDRLEEDMDLLRAVDHWLRVGRQAATAVESPRLDDAVKRFKDWLDGAKDENGNGVCTLRDHSRKGLRTRVNIFGNSVGNSRVADIMPDEIETFLGKLDVSPVSRDNYRRALSRFFGWCIERPRRWLATNPCRDIRIDKPEKGPPLILSVKECKKLLRSAEPAGLAPYVALCLFGGLRPFEASRLDWRAVNLKDKEIRLEANQTKTGRARVVTIGDTLLAWLEAYKGKSFFPPNWRKKFDTVKLKVGYGTPDEKHPKLKPWPVDVLRHAAISHYFRKTGSYGQTAEQFGNSEAIIKAHYQGRVSTEETNTFFNLKPKAK
jgi:integrase